MFAILCGSAQASELIGVCNGDNLCAASEGGKLDQLTKDGSADLPYASPSASADGSDTVYLRGGDPYLAGRRGSGGEVLLDTGGDGRDARITADGKSFEFTKFSVVFNGQLQFESALFVGGELGSRRYGSTRVALGGGFLGNELLIGTLYGDDGIPSRGGVDDEICTVPLIPSSDPPPCGTKVATQTGRSVETPSASPDGKLLAVESKVRDQDTAALLSSSIALFDPSTGQLVRELTSGPMDLRPEFSPDGKQVAFTRGESSYVVPAGGGEPKLLVRGLTDADWYGPAAKATFAGKKLKLKGRNLKAKVACKAPSGCESGTLTLKRKGSKKPVAKLRLPQLFSGKSKNLKAKVAAADAKAVGKAGKKGLKLKVSGVPAPKKIKIVAG